MDLFTARPDRIFGNLALASLLVGLPVGFVFALLGLLTERGTVRELAHSSLGSVLLVPTLILIAGTILAPLIYLLRRIGYAGPFSIYALSTAFSLVLMSSDLRAGLVGLALALPASYIFCRCAYPRDPMPSS